jgi:radical SAM superfamily enzyme YgiQ (UPF0313 family)
MKAKDPGCKVLLVTPPRGLWKGVAEKPWISTQPLGLAYVAASVRAQGYPVEIMDAYSMGLPGDTIREKIEVMKPDVVGISSLTPQWPDAESVADIVKGVDEKILTVVGGPHVTALPEDSAGHASVDIAVVGEGEAVMDDICATIAHGGRYEDVAGVVIGVNGTPVRTPPREKSSELDEIPFPAHDLLPHPDFYNPFPAWGNGGTFSCMISGRGCPYDCCFCDVTAQQGKRYRLRSAENIVDELTWLNRTFGVKTFSFRDPSVVCNRRRLIEMCRLMEERQLDLAWTCSSRANEVDPEMLVAMEKAGCRLVQYGIEVGNAEMLESIKKITRERVAQAVRDTRRAGISAHGYFLFGFVEETPETIEETISFARDLQLDSAGFAVMVPFPGTQEFEKYRQEGLLLTEDWRDYDVLGKPVYRHKHITNEQLARAPRRAYRRFYMRPGIMWAHARKMTSARVIRNYLRSARLMFN